MPVDKVVLRKERRARNALETEEGDVVQYLAAGGWFHLPEIQAWRNDYRHCQPSRIASAVHAGAGQQVLGWSQQQRCDLLVALDGDSDTNRPACLLYVNHHGAFWHYEGHFDSCSERRRAFFRWKPLTLRMDSFRRGLCEALTAVAPEKCRFAYAVTTSCSHVHGAGRKRSAKPSLPCAFLRQAEGAAVHSSARDCLLEARRNGGQAGEAVWLNPPEEYFDPQDLAELVAKGRATGFVTVQGGRESKKVAGDDPAGHRFGFCVQNHAARLTDLSERTVREMADHFGWQHDGENKLSDYLSRQPARTLNAATFFDSETVSTTYLRWLIEERGFTHFRITHFLSYEFRDWGSDYLLPVLQRRHEAKLAGNTGEAECLKLLGNGSYGYNGLESSNYDDLKLVTSENLARKLRTDFKHLSVKHLTQLGVVRVPTRARASASGRQRRSRRRRRRRRRNCEFFDNEAACDDDDDDDDDDDSEDDDHEREMLGEPQVPAAPRDAFFTELEQAGHSAQLRLLRNELAVALWAVPSAASLAPSEEDPEQQQQLASHFDHTYARSAGGGCSEETDKTKQSDVRYTFLWAVVTDGSRKRIFNTLPRAVAVLSNSKRLFLGHLSLLFRCLDPRLAEICYVDTDSCVWSLSHSKLEDCLLPEQRSLWNRMCPVADENGPVSCHGKLKLEGLFDGGLFKTMKIYRLFTNEDGGEGSALAQWSVAYTRCKGISRGAAENMPDSVFDPLVPPEGEAHRLAFYRQALRPTRSGEIKLVHESRCVALPFNFKRWVTPDGIHTLPFGLLPN